MKALFLVPLKQLHFIMFVLDCFDLGKKKGVPLNETPFLFVLGKTFYLNT
jgi:hypothetical protein